MMEVILLQKVDNLGSLGDRVRVRPGYGRNFLVPTGRAVSATKANIAAFEVRRAELERAEAEVLAAAQTRQQKIEALHVTIARKAGDEGRLFGSVGPADVAEAVTAAGVPLEKREVRMPNGPLHHLGEFEIVLHLHSDINTAVKVSVIPEG